MTSTGAAIDQTDPWADQPRVSAGSFRAIAAGTKGPLVVLIHGVGLRAEAWGGQIGPLSKSVRVLAVDLPGHGQSPRLQGRASLPAFGDAVADAFGEPAILIGHSMGAMIALDVACRFPDRVAKVAALNGIFERSEGAKEAVQQRAAKLDGQTPSDPEGTLTRWFGEALSPERTACQRWLTTVDPAGYREAYGVFAAEDGPSREGLASLRCPALFATGAAEPNSTPAMSQEMAALVPRGRAAIIPGAAHMMPMTHPAKLTEMLLSFATQPPDENTERS